MFSLFGFFFAVILTVGHVAFGQMFVKQALENSTNAGVSQISVDESNGAENTLSVQADAMNVANRTWALNQSVNPYVASASATFSTTSNSVTGNASAPIDESGINNFINSYGGQKANFGGNLTETVTSTLPTPPTSSLSSIPGSSLSTNTLPQLGSSLPSTTP